MSISSYDRLHVPAILADLKGERYDWFSAQLLRLIAKADSTNRAKIRLAFPDHVEAFEDWYHGLGVWKDAQLTKEAS